MDTSLDKSPVPGGAYHIEGASTVGLVALIRGGDRNAVGQLYLRHFEPLRRWATGRMPQWVRSAVETVDLVQDALLRTLQRLDAFEVQGEGALGKYLRTAVDNRIRDEHRRIARRGQALELDQRLSDRMPSPLEHTIAREMEDRYRAGLRRLRLSDRRLVVARVELGYSPQQLALLTGRRSADSARVALHRALTRLAHEMTHVPPAQPR